MPVEESRMSTQVIRSKRSARQKGNTALEAAFILIPLFGLIFAIVDFGLAIFVRSTMQHATREGVRYAITYQLKNGMAHDDSIKSVVTTNAMGFLDSDDNQEKIKIRYYDPATLGEVSANSPGCASIPPATPWRWSRVRGGPCGWP